MGILWGNFVTRTTHSLTKSYIIRSGSFLIAFISAANHNGDHRDRTPDHLFYADSGTVCGWISEYAKQSSHHQNELV